MMITPDVLAPTDGAASHFDSAIEVVLQHEGGFVNHPSDPGGATNFGVSLRWLKSVGDLDGDGWADGDLDHDGDVDIEDIRRMSEADARAFYKAHWWEPGGYDRIRNRALATKVFDLAVNMGTRQAHKLLQRACGVVGTVLTEDGVLGPKSMAAINACNPTALLAAYKKTAAAFYAGLIAKNPKFAPFAKGWANRAYA